MAALDCSKITLGLDASICTPVTPGTDTYVILVNFTDIDKAKVVKDENGVITSIALVSGAKGYSVASRPNAIVGSVSVNAGTYMNSFSHSVQVRVFEKTDCAKTLINELLNGKVAAIVANLGYDACDDMTSMPKYEIYGYEAGLMISELTSTTELTDSVVYDVTLSTQDGSYENSLPITIWDTDEATTDAMIESLYA